LPEITSKLAAAGFIDIGSKISYAGQAFILHSRKPAQPRR
jgi:hypothetical protein